MTTPDITLYHAPMSRSVRPRLMLEEMGLPYRLERLSVMGDERGRVGGEAYKAVNPMQKIPAMVIDGEVVLESLAMIQLLGDRFGPTDLIVGRDEPDYARYLEWLFFGEATMGAPINMMLGHTVLLPEERRIPAMLKWARIELAKQMHSLETRGLAGGREWLAGGRFTAADMSVAYMLFMMKITKQFDLVPEIVSAYFDRVRARPAWARATAD